MPKCIDVTGQKFRRLTVVRMIRPLSAGIGAMVEVQRECGSPPFKTESYSVRKGLAGSCGCLRKEEFHRTHGEGAKGKETAEYVAWVNMNTRCHNHNATRFKDWGGRGISVFPAWRHDYQAFLSYVGRRPGDDYSLDRFPNPNGNYEPGNTRWATRREQGLNTRRSKGSTTSAN